MICWRFAGLAGGAEESFYEEISDHSWAALACALGLGCLLLSGAGRKAPAARPKPLSAYDAQAKRLLARMTLEEKDPAR